MIPHATNWIEVLPFSTSQIVLFLRGQSYVSETLLYDKECDIIGHRWMQRLLQLAPLPPPSSGKLHVLYLPISDISEWANTINSRLKLSEEPCPDRIIVRHDVFWFSPTIISTTYCGVGWCPPFLQSGHFSRIKKVTAVWLSHLACISRSRSSNSNNSNRLQWGKIGKRKLSDSLSLVGSFLWKICLNNMFKSSGELFWSILV